MQPIDDALIEAGKLVAWLRDPAQQRALEELADTIAFALTTGHRVLSCGNGGSLCDSMHFAEELSGRFRRDRRALPAQAIADAAHLTCVANDWSFEHVFARGVEAWGGAGDVLLVFTTSGNSPNIVAAAEAAKQLGLTVCGLLGRDGGRVRSLCDYTLIVPAATSDRIQEIHIKVVHLVIEMVERRLFPENYAAPGPTVSRV